MVKRFVFKTTLILIFQLCFYAPHKKIKAQTIQDVKDNLKLIVLEPTNRLHQAPASQLFPSVINSVDSLFNYGQVLSTGKLFTSYHRVDGSPFLYEKPQNGTVYVAGEKYPNAFINYDIYADKLICNTERSISSSFQIEINHLLVDSFNIGNKTFINNPNENLGTEGYYQLIYKGQHFSFIAKWGKNLIKRTSHDKMSYFAHSKKSYYLLTDNSFKKTIVSKGLLRSLEINSKEFRKKYGKKLPKFSNEKELLLFLNNCNDYLSSTKKTSN